LILLRSLEAAHLHSGGLLLFDCERLYADSGCMLRGFHDTDRATRSRSGAKRTLQVVRVRDDDADQAPTLIVQDVAERASGAEL
jgi:hypothetical protein